MLLKRVNKTEQGNEDQELGWGKLGLLENVRLEQRPEGGEGVSLVDTRMQSISDRGNCWNRGYKAGVCTYALIEEQHKTPCGWEKRVRRKVEIREVEFREVMKGQIK